jgi:transcriptional regulator with XRE-family HTH domain
VRDIRAVLAANLERLLREKRMEKRALAAKAGMPASSVSRYLAKKQSPSIDVVGRMAAALEVPPAALLDDGSAPSVPPDHGIMECYRRVGEAVARDWARRAEEGEVDGVVPAGPSARGEADEDPPEAPKAPTRK